MSSSKKIDYLIIGQGLAGSLMGYFLEKRNKDILFIDNGHRNAATKAAAGIFNPITGRRFVKSWMIDDLFPYAEKIYTQLEKELNIKIYHRANILRALFNAKEDNEWMVRSTFPTYAPYIEEKVSLDNYEGKIEKAFSEIEMKQSGRVDISVLVEKLKEKWTGENKIIEEEFDYEKIRISENKVRYQNIIADKIIFCEGYKARFNPYFSELGYQGAKGEILMVEMPEAKFKKLLKHRLFIVPQGNDLYWVGATNKHNCYDEDATEKNYEYLKKRLISFLRTPFEIKEHKAAVRPTTKDRRPLLGLHERHPQLAILNGLGTKGASIGPYWANEMVSFLLDGKPLDKEVDIVRWKNKIRDEE